MWYHAVRLKSPFNKIQNSIKVMLCNINKSHLIWHWNGRLLVQSILCNVVSISYRKWFQSKQSAKRQAWLCDGFTFIFGYHPIELFFFFLQLLIDTLRNRPSKVYYWVIKIVLCVQVCVRVRAFLSRQLQIVQQTRIMMIMITNFDCMDNLAKIETCSSISAQRNMFNILHLPRAKARSSNSVRWHTNQHRFHFWSFQWNFTQTHTHTRIYITHT